MLFAEIGIYLKKDIVNKFISVDCNPKVQFKNVDCGGYVGFFFGDFIQRWWSEELITIDNLDHRKIEYNSTNVQNSGRKIRIEIAKLLER